MTKSRFFLYKDTLIVIIPPNTDISKWPCIFLSMRNCTLEPQSHFAVVCLRCSDPTQPWAVEKQLCSHYFYFWRSAWGNRNMICRLWFLKNFFFSLIFFSFGLLCLHRKLWIGIFVSFYSKFLLSHPPNLEPETTILPHPNSAGRPSDELGIRHSPKSSFLSLWQSSDLWSWCFHAAPRTAEVFIICTQMN